MDGHDIIYRNRGDGTFEDISAETGFDDVESHHGMAVGDVDGDGWLDIVLAGPFDPPRLWLNRCGSESWLDVELVGAGANSIGLGAIVEVELADGRVLFDEILGPRAQGQGPSRSHFGLGDASVASVLRIRWPGGAVTELTEAPTRRRIVAYESPR